FPVVGLCACRGGGPRRPRSADGATPGGHQGGHQGERERGGQGDRGQGTGERAAESRTARGDRGERKGSLSLRASGAKSGDDAATWRSDAAPLPGRPGCAMATHTEQVNERRAGRVW